jgi:hypothetical protein
MTSKVIIGGVEYVPVSESNPNAKQIAIALIKRYMGKFDESNWEELANELQVCVSEDMNEPSIMQTVAEILKATVPPVASKFTPDQFASLMRKIEGDGDIEGGHIEADELMCELLDSLGYHEGVAIFQSMSKWYA